MKYEIKLKVNLPDNNGELKPCKEHYVIYDAYNFTDAEAKGFALYNHEGANLDVTDIQRSRLYEIVNAESKDDTNAFFRVKITKVLVDEHGCDKETSYVSLFVGHSLGDVTKRVEEHMKQALVDYRIDGIQRTKIVAVL